MTNSPLNKVLQGLKRVSILILRAIELSEFDIEYVPKKANEAQMVAEVLVDFAKGKIKEPELGIHGKVYDVSEEDKVWQVVVDESSIRVRNGIKVVIKPLQERKLMYYVNLGFLHPIIRQHVRH